MVARGAGAAGPVLLACRQWDPLGLARRLPSLGVGAWRSPPLLPWRVQCPVRVCAALAAGSGGSGRYLVLCLSRFPLPARRVPRCVWRAVPSGLFLTLARWYAIPRGLCVPRARSGCPSGSPRVPFACVCARAPAASAPPPLGGVACAPRAVPALGAGRAVPRGPCTSACPAPVSCSFWRAWGGAVRSRFPPTWVGVVGVAEGRPRGGCLPLLRGASEVRRFPSPDCPPTGRAVGVRYPRAVGAGVWVWGPNPVPLACTLCGGCVLRGWWGAVPLPGLGLCAPRGAGPWRSCAGGRAGGGGGGGPCAAPPVRAAGGPVGRGVALPRSVPLPSLGRQQSGCHWRRSGHGGRGPHTTPVCARPPSLGAICAASWRVGAGSLVPHGSCGSRRLGRGGGPCSGSSLQRGEEGPSLLPRGVGAGAPAACGPVGGVGGGSRRGLPAPPLGSGPRFPTLAPLLSPAHSPPACAFGRGCGAARGGGGDEGQPVDRSPRGPFRPEPPLCPPRVGNGHGGGHGGRGLHTVLVRRRAPSPGLVRAPLRRAGAGSPVGRDPRGCRRLGASGHAVCRSSRTPPPPPPASRSLLGEGGRPLGSGGRRVAPVALKPGGGERGGRGGGAAPSPPSPPPRRASACHPLSPACPSGVYSCRGGCRAAAGVGRGPVGRQWVSAAGGGGGGGGNPPALVRAPVFPRPASKGAAPCAPSWGPPACRRSAAGRAGAYGRFPGGACRGRGAPSPRVQRPLRGGCGAAVSLVCLRPLLGLRRRGGGVGGALWSPGVAP